MVVGRGSESDALCFARVESGGECFWQMLVEDWYNVAMVQTGIKIWRGIFAFYVSPEWRPDLGDQRHTATALGSLSCRRWTSATQSATSAYLTPQLA